MALGSAPGSDGLTVRDPRKIPPDVLALITNNWLTHHHFPDDLRISRTVFIPKCSNASSPSELRPITISSVLVRLFSRLLLARLQSHYFFHPLQSGFSADRAAQSNLLLLQGLMKHAKRHNRCNFFAASLDLRKAFDSVSHAALLTSLREGGAHEDYIMAIIDMYSAQSTVYSFRGQSDGLRVYVQHGIKQGDPLSPFLFNLTLDPLMHSLNTSGFGYQIQGRTVSALAYADDLILVASTQELSRNLEAAQQHFSKIGLTLNPHKTQYIGWRYEAHRLKWFDSVK
ncbi:hypothetical protein MTO96_036115 [Rhipicephalus appendiculatus]